MWLGDMSLFGNSSQFVLEPGPEDSLVKCQITRSSKGLDKGMRTLGCKLSEYDDR